MLFRMIYDDSLSQAAYLIGCQQTGEAIIIDPQRDIDPFVDPSVVGMANRIRTRFINRQNESSMRNMNASNSGVPSASIPNALSSATLLSSSAIGSPALISSGRWPT